MRQYQALQQQQQRNYQLMAQQAQQQRQQQTQQQKQQQQSLASAQLQRLMGGGYGGGGGAAASASNQQGNETTDFFDLDVFIAGGARKTHFNNTTSSHLFRCHYQYLAIPDESQSHVSPLTPVSLTSAYQQGEAGGDRKTNFDNTTALLFYSRRHHEQLAIPDESQSHVGPHSCVANQCLPTRRSRRR